MKAWFIFICTIWATCSVAYCADQVKVIEKSAKKAPYWVNGLEKNYLIVAASADDLESAKEKALHSIREQIVQSVAVNVQSSVSLEVQETQFNGKVRHFLETLNSNVVSKSGNIPYLNEISLSNVTDFYWEKQQNKKTKAITVIYHIKYPFSEAQMQRLVFEFKETDKKMTTQLTELCNELEKISELETIDKNITALQQLCNLFDDTRKGMAETCIRNYHKRYSYVSLEETAQDKGSLSYRLMLGGKQATTIQKPRAKSNCADNIKITPRHDGADITYQTEGCYADLENYIEIIYNFGGKNISQKFFFTLTD